MFKTQFNTINSCAFEAIELQNRLETGLNLSDSLSERIISVSGEVGSGYVEITSGEIRYGGRVTFNVIYGDEMERLESGTEFSFKKLGDFRDGDIAEVAFSLGEITLKSNGGMLYAEALIDSKISLERESGISCLIDVDCLKKQGQLEVFENITANGNFEVEDEFDCAKCSKVLESHAEATLSAVSCGDGVINCDGEIVLSLVMLPFNRKDDIVKEVRVIPFNFELDCDYANSEMFASATVGVGSISLKVYVDEETESSKIGAVIGIKINAKIQRVSSLSNVIDVYSDSVEISCEQSQVKLRKLLGLCVKNEKINGKFKCDVPENSRFLGIVGERCEIVGESVNEDCVSFDYKISCDAIFIDGDGTVVSRKAVLFDKTEFDNEIGEVNNYSAKIVSISAKMRSGKIECEVTLRFNFTLVQIKSATVVSKIDEGEQKSANKSAISVYLASKGDTEWEVSKALGVQIDDIYEFNPTLEFPLVGNEKIITFRQK